MDDEPIWFKYATFDEDGFVNGISDDAPEEAKDAYRKEQETLKKEMESGEPIPKY